MLSYVPAAALGIANFRLHALGLYLMNACAMLSGIPAMINNAYISFGTNSIPDSRRSRLFKLQSTDAFITHTVLARGPVAAVNLAAAALANNEISGNVLDEVTQQPIPKPSLIRVEHGYKGPPPRQHRCADHHIRRLSTAHQLRAIPAQRNN